MTDLEKLVPLDPNWHEYAQAYAIRADTAKAVAQRCVEICREAQYRPDIAKLIAAEFGLDVKG